MREDWPELPALLVSGYEPGNVFDLVTLPERTRFLEKPFTADALLGAVRALLDHRSGVQAQRT